jgi:GNAT superfamily N-acetyltransferase
MAQEKFDIDIFRADASNLDELFALAERFWNESNYATAGLTLKSEFWKNTVRSHISLPDTAVFAARVNDEFVGYVMIYCQRDYTLEPIGEMFQFYVTPEHRGSEIARLLVSAADAQYKSWGCARAYCEASPGLSHRDHLGLFKNLWGKFGFVETGVTLMKEYR